MAKPNWENTFNAELRQDWGDFSYAVSHARAGGYPYILWEGNVHATHSYGPVTKWTKGDLYRHQG